MMERTKLIKIRKKVNRLKKRASPLTVAEVRWLLNSALLLVDDLNVELENITKKLEESA